MKFNKREKYGIYIVAVVAVLFVIAEFIVPPIVETRTRQQRSIVAKKQMLVELNLLSAEHETLQQRVTQAKQRMNKRAKNFTLFSFLERLSGQAKVKGNVAHMKPSTVVDKTGKHKTFQVEMKLRGVTLDQITKYIHMVETSENMVYIKRVSVTKAGKAGNSIDATLLVETYES
jgi:general secretion pathway protein M